MGYWRYLQLMANMNPIMTVIVDVRRGGERELTQCGQQQTRDGGKFLPALCIRPLATHYQLQGT